MLYSKLVRRTIFPISDLVFGKKISKYLNFLEKSQWWSAKQIKEYQNQKLNPLIKHAYENVPYYRKIWIENGIDPDDIKTIKDLSKLPILTKTDIRKNFDKLKSDDFGKRNPKFNATGGSTGEPLKFFYDWDSWSMDWACSYRGWGYAGYKFGDKMITVGGSSVVPGKKSPVLYKIKSKLERHIGLSAFDMNEKNIENYCKIIKEFRPKFLRGYPTAIYVLAEYCKNNNITFPSLRGIFTTAETLQEYQRKYIESVFGVRVFDGYGARDGGVNAYECDKHTGMHISAEKCVVEFVKDKKLHGNMKKILLTDLTNYSFPFIRYDVGDIGILETKKCPCGRGLPQIKKIVGRMTEIIKFSNGIAWGGPTLTLVFKDFDIIQYQVIQTKMDEVIIKVIKGKMFSKEDGKKLINIFRYHAGKNTNVIIKYVKKIPVAKSGKTLIVMNKVKR